MKKYVLTAAVSLAMLTADAQWKTQDPGFRADSVGFYEISIPSKKVAWAVCFDGAFGLLGGRPNLNFTRTTDGGDTWIPGKMGTDNTLRFSNISAINKYEAWVAMHKIGPIPGNYAIGSGGSFSKGAGIFHTTDGGVTWQQVKPGQLFSNKSVPRFVHFKNKDNGIAVGDPVGGYFEVYLTENGGRKWNRVHRYKLPTPLENEVGWISGHTVVGNTIWFGTSAGRMYKSTNFGKNWTVHAVGSLPGSHVHEIAFLDDKLRGVAHLRTPANNRTFVFSTTDGGLTWTNYFQPPNWKNSRVTAVPGTDAFVSTSLHGTPIFQGSAVSYDVGQTWTEIENTADKAACRFFDASTGYAGGLYFTGVPGFDVGGMFKSEIVFAPPAAQQKTNNMMEEETSVVNSREIKELTQQNETTDELVKVYPIPARNLINISFQDKTINTMHEISIINMDGKNIQTRKTSGKLIQMDVSRIASGPYMIVIKAGNQTVSKVITIAR